MDEGVALTVNGKSGPAVNRQLKHREDRPWRRHRRIPIYQWIEDRDCADGTHKEERVQFLGCASDRDGSGRSKRQIEAWSFEEETVSDSGKTVARAQP